MFVFAFVLGSSSRGWLQTSRGLRWPSGISDVIDYVHFMVEVPAPASFPQVFGGTLVWMESRSGFPESDFISGHPLIKRTLEWAELQLANEAAVVRKAPASSRR